MNGVPASEFSRADWHDRSPVPQEPRLLHATVAENIRYFRELDDEEIERAGCRARRASSGEHRWLDAWLRHGDRPARRCNLGRPAAADLHRPRAARRPNVLILDEPTSALDPRSESLLQESLVALKDELTLFRDRAPHVDFGDLRPRDRRS